jgi:signal transduction histidine kinase
MSASADRPVTALSVLPAPPALSLLWTVGLAGVAAAGLSIALLLAAEAQGGAVQAGLVAWITISYVFCGLLTWWRRPGNRFGLLLIAAGLAPFLSTLSASSAAVPYTVGEALRLLPPVLFLHVFLSYPSGRLKTRFERTVVATAYVAAVGIQVARMTLGGLGPENLIDVAHAPTAVDALRAVQVVAVSTLALCGIGVLLVRRRGGGRPLRHSRELLLLSFTLALLMIAVGVIVSSRGGPALEPIRWVTFALIGLAPVAFLLGLFRARLARSAVGELVVELEADPAPVDLEAALARAVGDPSLTLAYWLPDFGVYGDRQGRPVTMPPDHGRTATTIEREGAPLAVLVHDEALDDEPELLEAVSAATGLAVENDRLHAELRARLEEVQASRARVIEAGQKERQRLERNLHDGAQQRLIALSLDLSLLGERLGDDPEATRRLERARGEIAASLTELRAVAHGLHPAVVSGHGLPVALESLAAAAPLPVRLTVAVPGRLSEQLEVAAYYLVSETLVNVGKHAMATSASVDVTRSGGRIVVEIVDDGVGGADTELGSGLRGLADRVEALGGRLRIWSPPGGGTRVRAEIPCG